MACISWSEPSDSSSGHAYLKIILRLDVRGFIGPSYARSAAAVAADDLRSLVAWR